MSVIAVSVSISVSVSVSDVCWSPLLLSHHSSSSSFIHSFLLHLQTPLEPMSSSLPSTFVKGFHDEDAVRKMTYRPLGKTGMDVSIVSLGTSALGSVFRETKEEESVAVVVNAVKAGVNLLDSAAWYGHGKAEKVTGKALKQIPREAYFIMTKLGRYTPDVRCQFVYNRERTLASIDESLERLGALCCVLCCAGAGVV